MQVRIDIGPASDSIAKLAAEGVRWDLAFIDADKAGYLGYYNQVRASSTVVCGVQVAAYMMLLWSLSPTFKLRVAADG